MCSDLPRAIHSVLPYVKKYVGFRLHIQIVYNSFYKVNMNKEFSIVDINFKPFQEACLIGGITKFVKASSITARILL